ncbi:hypothetical protein Enr13x_28040 [Stieleria neptunia]|uniref:Phage-related minor tail protein n=1 Tax=Stieleria neptunia TaxID=2527979 RepID=A0A518HQ34_9BACT|nr:hypothetical protein [Stieleria neptunia]QDV42952.1 hypothetical protein Enr13x_28040 [Stieleria neptunia]
MTSSQNIDAGGASFALSLKDDLTRDLQSSLSNAVKAVRGVVGEIDREIKALGRTITDTGKQIAKIGAGASALGAGVTFGFARATIAAGDFAETLSMFDAVFKDQSESVRRWGENYAKTVGRSRGQLLQFLADAQDTFVPLGFDRKEATELSKTVAKLAIDLGSFKNIDDADALRSLLGGIIGNTENLRRFGVVAQEAQIKAQALSMGFDPSNLTAYQKALAILELTLAGTQDAQGDAIKTAGSFANSVRALKAAFGDLKNAIGQPLLEIGTSFVQGMAAVIQSINMVLEKFPLLTKFAAGTALAVGAVGAAATGLGVALATMGTSLATSGALLLVWTVRAQGLTATMGKMAVAAKTAGPAIAAATAEAGKGAAAMAAGESGAMSFGAALRAVGMRIAYVAEAIVLAFRSNIFKAAMGGIIRGLKNIISVARFAGSAIIGIAKTGLAAVARLLVSPIGLIAGATAAAMKGLELYYRRAEQLANKRGKQLDIERVKLVRQSFIDAGQTPPHDLFKTFNPNGARVVKNPAPELAALTAAQRGLVDEINAMRSPLETFRDRIKAASELLNRGEISKDQFNAFSRQEFDRFQQSDPATQARNSLADQLRTPAETLRKSVADARRLFADDAQMMRRAVQAAVDTFKATDPAEQMKQQLMTPVERMRQSIANAHKLFAGQPEFLRRAIAASVKEFKASQPTAADDPGIKAAEGIRDALKTDAQQVAEKMAEGVRLVQSGHLTKAEAQAFNRQLRDDFLGDNPGKPSFQQMAAQSAHVAANIGKFAPSFDNTSSEEKAYRRKTIELQQEMRKELRDIRRRRPAFI